MNDYAERICDENAERATIGAMLLGRDAITDVISIIDDGSQFYVPRHEQIFNAIIELYGVGEPADAVTVARELDRRGELKKSGGAVYLHTLMESVPSSANGWHYAKAVRHLARLREGRSLGQSLMQAMSPATTDASDVDEVLSAFADKILSLRASSGPGRSGAAHLAEIPEYPGAEIPGPLGALVRTGIVRGLDPALVGGAGLGALASVCGSARVETRPGQKPEPPALWIPLGGEPGAGKSPAMDLAFRPIYKLEEIEHEVYEKQLEEWESAPKSERGPRPVSIARINDDATIEVVARWLKRNGGHGGLVPDELTSWISGIGRYRAGGGDGGERARHLSLWDGSPWKFERVTSGIDIRIANPALTVCGGVQPDNYSLLGPESDGMRPRWLPHLALRGVSEWRGPGDLSGWTKALTQLYRSLRPRTWKLDETALKELETATARWRRLAVHANSGPSVTAAARKGDRQATRIALVLAESLRPGEENGLITVAEMTPAIRLVDYALACWASMPGHMALSLSLREEKLNQGVDQLAAWLESHGGFAEKRVIQAAKVAGARNAETLNALLSQYEGVYPGSIVKARIRKTGPETTVIYAPRRGATAIEDSSAEIPGTVDVNGSGAASTPATDGITALHGFAADTLPTADSVNSSGVNGSVPTVLGGAHA